jgi:aryl-alcohol dehydrogenase-like predicted oxidoreductase
MTWDDFQTLKIGIGTWSWGDRLIWSYGSTHDKDDLREAFQASFDSGIQLFDTSEAFGQGLSEKLLGEFAQELPQFHNLKIASKFMDYPWRFTPKSFTKALNQSLARLQQKQIFLYQIHYPHSFFALPALLDAIADACQSGLIMNVGVVNFDTKQIQTVYEPLRSRGIPLVSNQIEYNLLNRRCEQTGLLEVCESLNIRIIACSPLAMGLLTGKYSEEAMPPGLRGLKYPHNKIITIKPLVKLMRKIAVVHDGVCLAQVAINWLISKQVIPIPGVKNRDQVLLDLAALTWQLEEDEIQKLDEISAEINES